VERSCSDALSEFVECVWTLSESGGEPTWVLPDGCVDLLFERASNHEGARAIRIVGTMRRVRSVHRPHPHELLGVRFRPGGARALLGVDVARLVDVCVPWSEVSGPLESVDAVVREPSLTAAGEGIVHALQDKLQEVRPGDRLAARAAAAVVEAPEEKVCALAERVGVTRQHLRRLVVSAAGVAPKQLARIVRFRRVTERLRNNERPSASLALDCGYFDQAHMAREFRAFTGTTATDYARFHLSKTG